MSKQIIRYLLLIFLVADIGFSFFMYLKAPLDGDMGGIILPSSSYEQVLKDPLGFHAAFKHEIYAAPNRFLPHWSMSTYFKTMPFLVQWFTNPINSIYISCAIIKTAVELLLIYLLASIISSTKNIFKEDFLIAAALIAPLFQIGGYYNYMGIIDTCITYIFFYAWPLSLLTLFFMPFYKAAYYKTTNSFNIPKTIFYFFLTLLLSLSGPIIPGILVVICPLTLLNKGLTGFIRSKGNFFQRIYQSIAGISRPLILFFLLATIFSLYSLYIGQNNSENFNSVMSIGERYSLLLKGLLISVQELGIPLLLFFIILNSVIIGIKFRSPEEGKILNFLKWLGIFSVIYILLLPLGGYRSYRPFIIRYDTIMPVTIGFIFFFGLSSYFLIKNLMRPYRNYYIGLIIICLAIFRVTDHSIDYDNTCERNTLKQIAQSPDKIVAISKDCKVMTWDVISDYQITEVNCRLFRYWGVFDRGKYYYQK